jgi:hypothetical protein
MTPFDVESTNAWFSKRGAVALLLAACVMFAAVAVVLIMTW